MEKLKNNMAMKYYDIWNSIIECELELLEGDKQKEKIMLEQIQQIVNIKINRYK